MSAIPPKTSLATSGWTAATTVSIIQLGEPAPVGDDVSAPPESHAFGA
jgi:hypothetical protein